MKSTYKIVPDKLIIVETLSNDISPDLYTRLKHKEFADNKFNRNFNLVTDISAFDKNTDKNILQTIISIFKENKGKINRKKSAIVVSDKKSLKKIDLSIGQNRVTTSEIKVFTDIKEAMNWASG